EEELDESLCPWCIADGSAAKKFGAAFFDDDAIDDGAPQAAVEEICRRTPGYSSFQGGRWPVCCGDAAAYHEPVGIAEIRSRMSELEGLVISHVIYDRGISGGAAIRLVQSLDKDRGPTLFIFQCLKCRKYLFHIDQP